MKKDIKDYINPNPKKVSKAELKAALEKVNDKLEADRREMQQATNRALSDGFRCGPRRPRN